MSSRKRLSTNTDNSGVGGMSDTKAAKREGRVEWEDYFMALASLSAQRSKDPVIQVGACIVNERKRIVGMGYNGMPDGCHDNLMPWGKGSPDELKNKKFYVCHAEMNAIINKNMADVNGCTIYTTLFPCNECAKLIIQSGIKEVVYLHDKTTSPYKASKTMLEIAKVDYRKFEPKQRKIVIDLGDGGKKRKN